MSNLNPNAAAPQEPWGIWPTLSISAMIIVCFSLSGAIVIALYLGWEIQHNPALAEPWQQADFLLNIDKNGTVLAWTSLVSGAMCIGLIALAIRIRKGLNFRDYLNLHWPKWYTFIIWNALLLVLLVVVEIIARFFIQKSDFLEDILASDQTNLFWLCMAVVIMAPLFEEILFRGFMFKGMEKSRVGMIGTILITSFVWAIIHIQYDLFFVGVIFSLGLLFGYARHATKSLWVPMSMHLLNNALAMAGTAGWLHSVILN